MDGTNHYWNIVIAIIQSFVQPWLALKATLTTPSATIESLLFSGYVWN